ncbi:hypothetical protein G9A89_022451 [Geosiphon pyriformis]|nr:hypothetical protein G9A89_022451 [Geosiphon pyriformis]
MIRFQKSGTLMVKSGGLVKSSSPTFESPSRLDVSNTDHFSFIHFSLKDTSLPVISVYTDSFVKSFGTSGAVGKTAIYFSDLSLHIDMEVHGLLSSILAEIQASHFGVLDNKHADWLTDLTTSSGLVFSANIKEKILMADDKLAMSNLVEFVWSMATGHREWIWVPNSKLQAEIKCCGSLCMDKSLYDIIQGLPAKVSGGVVYLLRIERDHITNFGLSIGCLFFTGAAGKVTVNLFA